MLPRNLDMAINYSDLELAFEFVSSGYEFEHSAYFDKETGVIYYDSDASEDELPEDLFENEKYIAIPSKRDFGLGKPLAIEYAQYNLPDELDLVCSFFRSKGAYSNFKSLLENKDQLDNWYSFEQEAMKKAILEWCAENEISI